MTYGAYLDQCVALETPAKGKYTPGFRFNACLWQSAGEPLETILEFYVKGFRVKGGFIHLPAMAAKFSSYPIVFLPVQLAEKLVHTVVTDTTLRERFPEAFPLAASSLLVENLIIPAKDIIRDFPALAVQRGLIGG